MKNFHIIVKLIDLVYHRFTNSFLVRIILLSTNNVLFLQKKNDFR
jgi:hypothetical protein